MKDDFMKPIALGRMKLSDSLEAFDAPKLLIQMFRRANLLTLPLMFANPQFAMAEVKENIDPLQLKEDIMD